MTMRWEWVSAVIGLALVALGLLSHSPGPPVQGRIIQTPVCSVPAFVIKPAMQPQIGSAVVLHGLAANRRIMRIPGEALAAAGLKVFVIDLPGHGDNTEPFSFARAEDCAAAVVNVLAQRGEIELTRTTLVGHSMGAAIMLRAGDWFTTAATIAISPPPMNPVPGLPENLLPFSLPVRLPNNLLVFYEQLELPYFGKRAKEMLNATGGRRTSDEDFRQRNAADVVTIPRVAHTSILFKPEVWEQMGDWVRRAVAPAGPSPSPVVFNPLGLLALPLGLGMIFPALTRLFGAVLGVKGAEEAAPVLPFGKSALIWVLASVVSTAILQWFVPLAPLRMYTGAYLASALLLAGLLVLILFWWIRGKAQTGRISNPANLRRAPLLVGAGMGFYVVFALGGWLNADWTDAWPTAARWWRLAVMVPVLVPYFLAEELTLGPARSGWLARASRKAKSLALRGLVWLPMVVAVFWLGSEHILLFLMAAFLIVFSIAQRMSADAVRRRTGSAPAAAVFSAILAAWFIAAVFPLL